MSNHGDLHWFSPVRADDDVTPNVLADRLAPFGVQVKWDSRVPVTYFVAPNAPDVLMMELGVLNYSDAKGVTVRPRAGLGSRGQLALLGSVEPLTILKSPKRDPGWGRHRSKNGSWWTTCISVPVPDEHGFVHLIAANPLSHGNAEWFDFKDHGQFESAPLVTTGQVNS